MDLATYAVLNKKIDAIGNVPDEKITEAVNTYLDENPVAPGATSEQAKQIQDNANKIAELKGDLVLLDNLLKKTLSQDYNMKIALDNLFKCVAYDGDSDYANAYENFKRAFGIDDVQLLSITAVFNGNSAPIGTDAKDLNITVTGHYSNGTTAILTGWTIDGTVDSGDNVFEITFGGFTASVSVTGNAEALPSGYTRCSFIKSNGNQYITVDGIKMIAGTDKFVMDFKLNSDALADSMLFGGFTGEGVGRIGLNWNYGYLNYNGSNEWITKTAGLELSKDNRVVAILDTYNGIVQLGETQVEFVPGSYNSTNLCIFGYQVHSNTGNVIKKASICLYRFSIYRNDILIADFVPCLKDSGNVAGLYDLVAGVFYKSNFETFEYEVA